MGCPSGSEAPGQEHTAPGLVDTADTGDAADTADTADAADTADVEPSNEAPTARIDTPAAGAVLREQEPVRLEGTVADAESPSDQLRVRWTVNGDEVCGGAPEADGVTRCEVTFAAGAVEAVLEVVDPEGLTATASVAFTVSADEAPSCTVVAPADGGASLAGSPVLFEGSVADVDDPAEVLDATWTSDLDGVLATGSVDDAGRTTLEVSTLRVGPHVIDLAVGDGRGGACAASLAWNVGTAPTVELVSPVDGDGYNEDELVPLEAWALDAEDAPGDLVVTWSSDVDGVLDVAVPDPSGEVAFATPLSAGAHVITATVADPLGFEASASATVWVNAIPSAPTVSLSPDPAGTDDALTAAASGSVDPDGDAVTYQYAWSVDGVASTASTTEVLPASATTRGETWRVTVTPDDGGGTGTSASASITIVNTPPELDTVDVSLVSVQVGDTVFCAADVADADGDSVSLTWHWEDEAGALLSATDTWTVAAGDVTPGGEALCVVDADDGYGGSDQASARVKVANTAPMVDALAVSPSSAGTTDTLRCVGLATDADGDTLAENFVWTVDGTIVGTGDTWVVDAADTDPGDTVTCTWTVEDGWGGEDSASADATVVNTAPVVSAVTVSAAVARIGDTLTCTASATDVDDEPLTGAWAWYVGSTLLGTGSSYTLTGAEAAPGDSLTCVYTATDTAGDSGSGSASALVENAPPVVGAVHIAYSGLRVGDTLTCSGSASDPDGDPLSESFAWSVAGATVATTDSYTIAAADTDPGDTLVCTWTVSDGRGGADAGSDAVVVENTPPTDAVVDVSPLDPAEGVDDIVCLPGGSVDADEDPISYTITWAVDGVEWTGATTTTLPGDTVPASVIFIDEEWTCTATPSDGTDEGGAASGSVVVVSPIVDLLVDGTTTVLAEGSYEYGDVSVINGGMLAITGLVTLDATSFYVDSTSSVDGEAGGYDKSTAAAGTGSGAGGGTGSRNAGGGGGGYGGAGGDGGYDFGDTVGYGGASYGTPDGLDLEAGSAGGNGNTAKGGDGGAAFSLAAATITIEGEINMNGAHVTSTTCAQCGGGGAGGGILLRGDEITLSGTLTAAGGAAMTGGMAANDSGGGGGGGRIKVFYDTSLTTTGFGYNVDGGAGGPYGTAGTGLAGALGSYHAGWMAWP
jgi:hypothetical protein